MEILFLWVGLLFAWIGILIVGSAMFDFANAERIDGGLPTQCFWFPPTIIPPDVPFQLLCYDDSSEGS